VNQLTIDDPTPAAFSRRFLGLLVGVVTVSGVYGAALALGLPTSGLKMWAAVAGVYGTFAQLYLAADHGPARRSSENDDQYNKRHYWRDRGDMLAWAALGASVLAVVVAELSDAI
jgi:hypothetical protein